MHTLRKGQALNNKTTYKVSRSLVQHFVFKTQTKNCRHRCKTQIKP